MERQTRLLVVAMRLVAVIITVFGGLAILLRAIAGEGLPVGLIVFLGVIWLGVILVTIGHRMR